MRSALVFHSCPCLTKYLIETSMKVSQVWRMILISHEKKTGKSSWDVAHLWSFSLWRSESASHFTCKTYYGAVSAVSGAFLRTIFSHFFRQVRIKAQRVLSSCIDVFDNFARTLVPPTLSKLQNNPDVSHEEFKVCCPFIVGYNCSLSRKFLQFSHVLRLSSNFPMQWFETRHYLKWLLQECYLNECSFLFELGSAHA